MTVSPGDDALGLGAGVELDGKDPGVELAAITPGMIRLALLTQPLTLCSVLPFGLVNAYCCGTGSGLIWSQFGWGALGWYIALLLRGPVVGVAKAVKLSPKTLQRTVILSSGPCEEAVRAIALWAWPGNHDFMSAFSLGLGWAAIEAAFTVIQGLVMINLLGKNDDKAMEARRSMIEFLGRDTTQDNPLWAPLERIAANMGHIWFSLAIRLHPALVVPVAIAHSCCNWGAVSSMNRWGIARTELGLVAVMGSAFLALFFATRPSL